MPILFFIPSCYRQISGCLTSAKLELRLVRCDCEAGSVEDFESSTKGLDLNDIIVVLRTES